MSQPCSACGAINAAGAKFCRGCGAKVEAAVAPVAAVPVPAPPPPAPPPPTPGTCPQCGKDNLPAARFCRHCGIGLPEVVAAQVTASAPEPEWDPAPAPHPRPIGHYLLGGIAALAVIGAAGWFGQSLIGPTAPMPAATTAAATATPAAVSPFETIKFERIIDGNSVYSAIVTAQARGPELLEEGRRYCLANTQEGCTILLIANGRTFPSAEFATATQGNAGFMLITLVANGSLIGSFDKRSPADQGKLKLDCNAVPSPGNDAAIVCMPSAGKRADATEAAAMPADAAVLAAADPAVDAAATPYYLVADANLRASSTIDSTNNGKLSRGTMLTGSVVIGEDGKSSWLKLAGGKGYVSAVNLSANSPPQLNTIFGARAFKPEEDLPLYAGPDTGSALVDTIPAGTAIVITGITGNGFVEAKGRRGGVGYFPSAGHNLGAKR